jgi:hypothetical protein
MILGKSRNILVLICILVLIFLVAYGTLYYLWYFIVPLPVPNRYTFNSSLDFRKDKLFPNGSFEVMELNSQKEPIVPLGFIIVLNEEVGEARSCSDNISFYPKKVQPGEYFKMYGYCDAIKEIYTNNISLRTYVNYNNETQNRSAFIEANIPFIKTINSLL